MVGSFRPLLSEPSSTAETMQFFCIAAVAGGGGSHQCGSCPGLLFCLREATVSPQGVYLGVENSGEGFTMPLLHSDPKVIMLVPGEGKGHLVTQKDKDGNITAICSDNGEGHVCWTETLQIEKEI